MKFIVSVEGKIIVEAKDKDAAQKVAAGVLASRLNWLTPSTYGTARVADAAEIEKALELTPSGR